MYLHMVSNIQVVSKTKLFFYETPCTVEHIAFHVISYVVNHIIDLSFQGTLKYQLIGRHPSRNYFSVGADDAKLTLTKLLTNDPAYTEQYPVCKKRF